MQARPVSVLPKNLINKIAAGEVIERPASIVKELIENSLDAGSTFIELRIRKGGLELIEVSDNGQGLDSINAPTAFKQHATSKITSEADLENIVTMGFRGEALPSIASIASTTMHTFDGKTRPVWVEVIDGEIKSRTGEGRTQGTTVSVRDIFANIPARKKFLRTLNTEFKYIQDVFTNLALANPHIGFKLLRDDKLFIELKGEASLSARILQLYNQFESKLLPVELKSPDITITGFIGHPELAGRSSEQFLFLNQRFITDRLVTKAVKDGFSTTLDKNQKPVYFIYLQMPTQHVDVNVHPRKLEVRFLNPGLVYAKIKSTIAKTLENSLQQQFRSRLNDKQQEQNQKTPLYSPGKLPDIGNDSQGGFKRAEITDRNFPPRHYSQEAITLEHNGENKHPERAYLQLFDTYILFQQNEKLLVIDQHAADERIKYESLLKAYNKGQIATQSLLVAEIFGQDYKLINVLEEQIENLNSLGFSILPFSKSSWQLVAVPALLAEKNFLETLSEILCEIENSGNSDAAFAKATDHIFATMACHSSIRAGLKLLPEHINKLVSDLFACDLPYSCPHGRPIIWEVTRYELEKQFKRKK